MWIREYTFNVIIQPFHLLIYTVLVGTAMQLVTSNMIYGCVAIGFIIPAEKLMRSFFGFDNSGTLSAAGSFAGGALFSAIINKINRPKSGSGGRGSGSGDGEGTSRQVRKANVPGTNGMINPAEVLSKTNGTGGDLTPRESTNPGGRSDLLDDDSEETGQALMGGSSPRGNDSGGGLDSERGNDSGGNSNSERGNDSGGNSNSERGDNFKNYISASGSSNNTSLDYLTQNVFKNGIIDRTKLAFSRFGSRLGNATRSAGYRAKYRAINGIKKLPGKAFKATGRTARRLAVGGALGLPLAFMGAAVGAASGDLSNVTKLAGVAGAAGYYGANYYGDKLANAAGSLAKDMKTGAVDAFWGTDKKKLEQAKFDRDFKNDPNNIDALTKALGSRSKAIDAMKNGNVQAFLNNGITDPGKIGRSLVLMERLEEGKNLKGEKVKGKRKLERGEALQRAVAVAALNKNSGRSIYEANSYARKAYKENFEKQLIQQSKGTIDKATARNRVDEILDMMEFID